MSYEYLAYGWHIIGHLIPSIFFFPFFFFCLFEKSEGGRLIVSGLCENEANRYWMFSAEETRLVSCLFRDAGLTAEVCLFRAEVRLELVQYRRFGFGIWMDTESSEIN